MENQVEEKQIGYQMTNFRQIMRMLCFLLVVSICANIFLLFNYFRPFDPTQRALKLDYQNLFHQTQSKRADAGRAELEMLSIKFLYDFSSNWSPEILYSYLSSSLLEQREVNNVDSLCKAYSSLGKYLENDNFFIQLERNLVVVNGRFEHAEAAVSMRWEQEEGTWKLAMIRIRSDRFFDFARHDS